MDEARENVFFSYENCDEKSNKRTSDSFDQPTSKNQSAYDRANFLQRCTFLHLRQLKGKLKNLCRNLTLDDFDNQTPNDCLSKNARHTLTEEWRKELSKADNRLSYRGHDDANNSPKLLHAIVRAYGQRLTFAWFLFILSEGLFEPMYFYYCIRLIDIIRQTWQDQKENSITVDSPSGNLSVSENLGTNYETSVTTEDLYMSAVGIVVALAMSSIMMNLSMWQVSMIAMQMRTALGQMIFRKSLRADKFSQQYNHKQAISLVAKDLDLIDSNLTQIVWMISGPIECIVLTILLAANVGHATAAISLIMALLLAMARSYTSAKSRKHTRKAAKASDIRVALINETLKAIKLLRVYAWTETIYERIKLARDKELGYRVYRVVLLGVDLLLFFTGAPLGAMVTLSFGHYFMGVHLNQAIVSQIFLVSMIHQRTLSRNMPIGFNSLIDLTVVLERIGKYLRGPEITDRDMNTFISKIALIEKNSIELDRVSSKWLDSDRPSLDRISIAAKPGELILIAGKVGSGKSSLLQTLVNELTITSGSVRIKGNLSYASQEAWVFSGTVRENILFGAPMNMARYLDVLKVCCLLADLSSFSRLDLTFVGQRGVSLSGGQKARINLARCLYQEADVYLLDDPLSAVDAHVSKHLFHQAIKGFLGEKTVLLVTHQLQYMRFADKVLLISASNSKSGGATCRVEKGEIDQTGPADEPQSSLVEMQSNEEKLSDQMLLEKIKASRESESHDEVINEMEDSILQPGRKSRFLEAFGFYVKESGSVMEYILFALLNVTMRAGLFGTVTWFSYWAGIHNQTNDPFGEGLVEQMSFTNALIVTSLMMISMLIAGIARGFMLYKLTFRGAKRIHEKLIGSLLWAKMRFFDLTPPGQVINRVAADLSYMDTTHVSLLHELSTLVLSNFVLFTTMAASEWRLLIGVIFVASVIYLIFTSYITLTNQIKRVDGIRKGQIYTHMSITLDGLTTIRASDKSDMFARMYDQIQDKSSSVAFLHISVKRLIITRIDWTMIVFIVSMITIDVVDTLNGEAMYAFVGLNLVMQLFRNTQGTFTKFVELYTRIEALNRIKEYCNVVPEISPEEASSAVGQTSASLKEGRLEFVGVSLRYEPTSDIVLRNVSFVVEPREKIGIVGRTGAGKSSLISVLFRLYHFEGFVMVDGQDTKCVSLDSLRRSISIIPQDPELLSGSLRRNLDPLGQHTDDSLWRALDAVRLKALVRSNDKLLELQVSESGANFSVGQRQLICLARAILRRNRLLVLDEATANVDPDTDQLIQRAIRTEFAECTVLTVAHKLSTIVDSDRIMVIDKGRLVEFDSPRRLLESDGLFASMIRSSGVKVSSTTA